MVSWQGKLEIGLPARTWKSKIKFFYIKLTGITGNLDLPDNMEDGKPLLV